MVRALADELLAYPDFDLVAKLTAPLLRLRHFVKQINGKMHQLTARSHRVEFAPDGVALKNFHFDLGADYVFTDENLKFFYVNDLFVSENYQYWDLLNILSLEVNKINARNYLAEIMLVLLFFGRGLRGFRTRRCKVSSPRAPRLDRTIPHHDISGRLVTADRRGGSRGPPVQQAPGLDTINGVDDNPAGSVINQSAGPVDLPGSVNLQRDITFDPSDTSGGAALEGADGVASARRRFGEKGLPCGGAPGHLPADAPAGDVPWAASPEHLRSLSKSLTGAISRLTGLPAGTLYATQNGHVVHELSKLKDEVTVRLRARMRGGMQAPGPNAMQH
eukprot:11209040-Heterocapsa_arctica.AAC.1